MLLETRRLELPLPHAPLCAPEHDFRLAERPGGLPDGTLEVPALRVLDDEVHGSVLEKGGQRWSGERRCPNERSGRKNTDRGAQGRAL